MKLTRHTRYLLQSHQVKRLLSTLVLSILVASTSVGCSQPCRLTIFSITGGNVSVMKAGVNEWVEAEVGMSLQPGDAVVCGDDSSAEITFVDGSAIELQVGTEIEIDSLGITETGSATIVVKQAIGSIIFRVTKAIDPASRYEVETPAGVVAVRGSAVQVYVIGDGTTWAINLEGDIRASAQGVEVEIPEGRQCIVRPDEPPELLEPFFGGDAYLSLNGPATLPPEERNPCMNLVGGATNMIVDSVRVDLPDGGSLILPAVIDLSMSEAEGTTLSSAWTCEPGMPPDGGEYVFTGLDVNGQSIPGATDTDIWVAVEAPDPPTNVTAEVVENGILVSWDESPTIPGSFEPAAEPQLGSYQLGIDRLDTGRVVYQAMFISAPPHLIPRDKADFVTEDHGLSLSEMEDGIYALSVGLHSVVPAGSPGKGAEYRSGDPGQVIVLRIQNGEITIE